MIPKIIHFVWVGDQPKSELVLKCIASWKQFLPDYEIIEWDNEKFAQIDNRYAQQAFEYKKWAFVSDYIRLYALLKYGGFYFDSDLEITADISRFRELDFVTGYELYNNKVFPITALMGAVPNQRIIAQLHEHYQTASFVTDHGLNLTPNTELIAGYFEQAFALQRPYDAERVTELSAAERIYPYGYFCTPSDQHDNYSIHHFSGSWVEGYNRKKIFSIGPFSLLKFKKVSNIDREMLPLLVDERLLLKVRKNKLKTYCLIYKKQ